MSVPKVKCPSCGTEWAGPVVFCGECGTPITSGSQPAPSPGPSRPPRDTSPSQPGDRVARMPPAPAQTVPMPNAATVPLPPAQMPTAPTVPSPGAAPAKPIVKSPPGSTKTSEAKGAEAKGAEAKGAEAKGADPSRPTRPSDLETRRTVMGMPAAATTVVVPPPEPAKSGRRDAAPGKRSRKGSIRIPVEPTTSEETEKMLEALDAGFDSIVRPSEVPVIPITPSVVPEVPAPLSDRISAAPPVTAATSAATPAIAATPATAATPAATPAIAATPATAATPAATPAIAATPATAAPVAPPVTDASPTTATAPTTAAATAPAPEPTPPAASEAPSSEPEIAIAALAPAPDEATARAQHESDMAAVRALFSEMAVAHARPLRDFMIEVSWGDPTREWLDIAGPASSALRRAAEALEMPDLGAALDGFAAALDLAAGEASLGKDAKDLLLGAYGKLVELMPAAFALEGERGRREPVIVRSLLLQVSGVQKVAIDKIYAAGLTSLEMLYAAGPRELAETTGLDVELTARIHDRFQRYRREEAQLDPGKDRAAERAELRALTGDLARAHDEHEALTRAWSNDAAAGRARARKERGDVLLRIHVLLARMGEVDRLKALEKVPFAQKIRDLQAFLDEADRRASRP
ncbi:MAG: hypothetical protein QM820_01330 [Minicystis sp.]